MIKKFGLTEGLNKGQGRMSRWKNHEFCRMTKSYVGELGQRESSDPELPGRMNSEYKEWTAKKALRRR
jgi:hypothetical protein